MAPTPDNANTLSPNKASQDRLIAVAGNPNCGKTTLFNALTGLRHKVGNYAGVTVEKREAFLFGQRTIRLLDLPGIYSLSARSPDEVISRDVLLGRTVDTPQPDAVLVVIDAMALERNLFLATQIIELGCPVVIACNMMDSVEKAGHRLDLAKLSGALGVPVIGTVATRGQGVNAVRDALEAACQAPSAPPRPRAWGLCPKSEAEITALAKSLVDARFAAPSSADGAAVLLLSEAGAPSATNHLPSAVDEAVRSTHDRLTCDCECEADISFELTAKRYAWLRDVVDQCMVRAPQRSWTLTDRVDAVLTHRVWGKLCFGMIMAAMFYSIFILADPLMGLIDESVVATQQLVSRLMPEGLLSDLLRNGVVAGVGGVLLFFPQICILFLFIALLEDSGYMARAAFLMNRFMSRVGLHGKSFIPLLSAHACAIPGIMATRTIENPRDRLVTIMVAPLMSCSARLPVYTLVIAACLPLAAGTKAMILFGLYALGIVSAFVVALVLKKTILRGPTPGFIIELPPYRLPRPKAVLMVLWDRCWAFLSRAGTVILAITIVLWALTAFPRAPELTETYEQQREAIVAEADAPPAPAMAEQLAALAEEFDAAAVRQSYAGRIGRFIEPAIEPLGFNWEIGVGILASFAAREVFVGTLGIVYSVGEAEATSESLLAKIRAARWPDGDPLFTPLTGVSILVFFAFACQCLGTVAVVKSETHSWRWPIFQFAYMSVLAYGASLAVYQIGTALGY